jgi:hypothetical protein
LYSAFPRSFAASAIARVVRGARTALMTIEVKRRAVARAAC